MDSPGSSSAARPPATPAADESDGALLERFANDRSAEAFAALFARYGALVHATCRRVLGDAAAADDASQAAFLVLMRKAADLPRDVVLGAWLHATATHCARDLRRETARRARREGAVASPAVAAVETSTAPGADLRRRIDEALAGLPAEQRETILLRFFEGLSSGEAARRLGCAEKTVRIRLYRAMRTLRARLRTREALTAGVLAALFAPSAHAAPPFAAPIGAAASTAATACAAAVGRAAVAAKLVALAATLGVTVAVAMDAARAITPTPAYAATATTTATATPTTTATAIATSSTAPWSIGYWGRGPMPIAAIPWSAVSHVVHVAAEPLGDGSLRLPDRADRDARAIVGAAHAHDVRALMYVCSSRDSDFTGAATRARPALVEAIARRVEAFGYDGVDLWWTTGFDGAAMDALLVALRSRLPGRALCVGFGAGEAAHWAAAHALVDRLVLWAVDEQGTWNPFSWFNCALAGEPGVWSLAEALDRALAAGVPAAQIAVSIPFYGWVSRGGGVDGPRQPWGATPPAFDQRRFARLDVAYDLASARRDARADVPWLPLPDGWITFDDARSVADKVAFARARGLGGWFVWTLDGDYEPDRAEPHPLARAVERAWRGDPASATPAGR